MCSASSKDGEWNGDLELVNGGGNAAVDFFGGAFGARSDNGNRFLTYFGYDPDSSAASWGRSAAATTVTAAQNTVDFTVGLGKGVALGGYSRDYNELTGHVPTSAEQAGQTFGHIGTYVAATVVPGAQVALPYLAARDASAGVVHTGEAIARGDTGGAIAGAVETLSGAAAAPALAGKVVGAVAEYAVPGITSAVPALTNQALRAGATASIQEATNPVRLAVEDAAQARFTSVEQAQADISTMWGSLSPGRPANGVAAVSPETLAQARWGAAPQFADLLSQTPEGVSRVYPLADQAGLLDRIAAGYRTDATPAMQADAAGAWATLHAANAIDARLPGMVVGIETPFGGAKPYTDIDILTREGQAIQIKNGSPANLVTQGLKDELLGFDSQLYAPGAGTGAFNFAAREASEAGIPLAGQGRFRPDLVDNLWNYQPPPNGSAWLGAPSSLEEAAAFNAGTGRVGLGVELAPAYPMVIDGTQATNDGFYGSAFDSQSYGSGANVGLMMADVQAGVAAYDPLASRPAAEFPDSAAALGNQGATEPVVNYEQPSPAPDAPNYELSSNDTGYSEFSEDTNFSDVSQSYADMGPTEEPATEEA
jgi:hypothetical protein